MPKDEKPNHRSLFIAIVLLLLVSLLHGYLNEPSDADIVPETTVPSSQNEADTVSAEEAFPQPEELNPPVCMDAVLGGVRLTDRITSSHADSYEEPEPLPAYVSEEAETVVERINSHGDGKIIFPFLSDAHCGYYTDPENAAAALAGQLMNEIGKQVDYSFIAHGGDMSTGAWNTTRELTFSHVEAYADLLRFYNESVPLVWAVGNHDDAPYRQTSDRVTQEQTHSLVGIRNVQSGVLNPESCNYGYLDLDDIRLRVIVLDTDDKRSLGSVEVGAGEPGPEYLNAHNIGPEQLRWLADVALDFSEKENPEEWSVVVISHVALDESGRVTDVDSGERFEHSTVHAAKILSAYQSGSQYWANHNGEVISCDFSAEESRAEIICAVHGHEHRFCDEMVSGILSIGCPNIMNGRERKSDDGKIYEKIADSAEGTSFCILTIDRENRRIYVDAVGAGYDREFSY